MKTIITPSPLSGEIDAPASKSVAHRALICASFAEKPTQIICSTSSDDIEATADCLRALGAEIERTKSGFSVKPITAAVSSVSLNCRESGSTLRFLLPVACVLGSGASFYGEGSLPSRPLRELVNALSEHGAEISADCLPLKIEKRANGGCYKIDGGVSSQFISGLALALPLTNTDSSIVISGKIQSRPYIEMTLNTMKSFGVSASFSDNEIRIPACHGYRSPAEITVEGDWSNAAFFMCAAAMGTEKITVNSLKQYSCQGDRAVVEILKKFGAETVIDGDSVTVMGDRRLPLKIDTSDIPDLVPVLAVMCCFAKGTSVFYNASRLRMKESDRLQSTAAMINSLGGRTKIGEDSLTVFGTGELNGGTVDSFGDHRIAMAAAVAASMCSGRTDINGSEAVNKSFPSFFEKFAALGGIAQGRKQNVVNDRSKY